MRRVTKEAIRLTAAILATSGLAACGVGPQASGSFQTRASYDRLFEAAENAVPVVGYRITNKNKVEGLITAEQNVVMGRGSAVSMTAEVSNAGGVRSLRVSFIAPPGTFAFGDFGENVTEYISAVRTGVPDLRASAR